MQYHYDMIVCLQNLVMQLLIINKKQGKCSVMLRTCLKLCTQPQYQYQCHSSQRFHSKNIMNMMSSVCSVCLVLILQYQAAEPVSWRFWEKEVNNTPVLHQPQQYQQRQPVGAEQSRSSRESFKITHVIVTG